MDEKGFLISITSQSKRVFSKQLWERKEVTAGLQDSSREWITVLACICADRTAVKPSIIYAGKRDLRSSWVEHIEPEQHLVFF
jgi:hypothetical protein